MPIMFWKSGSIISSISLFLLLFLPFDTSFLLLPHPLDDESIYDNLEFPLLHLQDLD